MIFSAIVPSFELDAAQVVILANDREGRAAVAELGYILRGHEVALRYWQAGYRVVAPVWQEN
jgi:hypothetical protein